MGIKIQNYKLHKNCITQCYMVFNHMQDLELLFTMEAMLQSEQTLSIERDAWK